MNKSIFADNILSLVESSALPETDSSPELIDERYDELADAQAPWSWEKRVNFKLMQGLKPHRSVALVGTVRNEGINLIEWIAHCRAVGFEKIFLYTNDNTDGSEALLRLLHQNGIIQLLINQFKTIHGPQVKAYEHSVHLLRALRNYEWVAYLDADEFLIPAEHFDYNVQLLVSNVREYYRHHKPMSISLNWMWFGSENFVERQKGLVQETFLTAAPHWHVKSIVRLQEITTMWPIHIADPEKRWSLNGDLKPIFLRGAEISPEYYHGQINHYFHKSFEEYAYKLYRNKAAGSAFAGKNFDNFFHWDVMNATHRQYPPPPVLLARVKAEIETLMKIDGIPDAVAEVEKRYTQLIADEIGEDIQTLHQRVVAAMQQAPG